MNRSDVIELILIIDRSKVVAAVFVWRQNQKKGLGWRLTAEKFGGLDLNFEIWSFT